MTIRTFRVALATPALLLLVACNPPAPPVAPATPAAPAAPAVAPHAEPAAAAEEQAEAIPADADAIWRAIDGHRAELKAAVGAGDLSSVHHHAFAIRDLVAALPAHTPQLPQEERDKLSSEVAFVATLAGRLDAAGDGGDRAAAQAAEAQLDGVLSGMNRYK